MTKSGSFTCILIANQLGSDSEAVPVPVHVECWDMRGVDNGYTRVKGAQRFVPMGTETWYELLPKGSKCYICGETI